MNFLQKLFGGSAAVVEAPAPEAGAAFPSKNTGPTSHKDFLRAELLRLDGELAESNAAILAFRHANTTFMGGRMVLLYPAGNDPGVERARIETEWKSLLATREKILEARNKNLSEFARL
jgi:hypothetical protein